MIRAYLLAVDSFTYGAAGSDDFIAGASSIVAGERVSEALYRAYWSDQQS